MDPKKRKRLSHTMSALLRHRAGKVGMQMDRAGWVTLDELCRHLRASRRAVEEVVAHNNKTRFEVAGQRIRASQGHSLDHMPITQEALEASWTAWSGMRSIWHGTQIEVIESIARDGILRGDRSHVHLAETIDSQVGKRANVAVMLEVSPARLRAAGYEIYRSPNGVILARQVPPDCIVDVVTTSRRSKRRAPELRAAFDRMV